MSAGGKTLAVDLASGRICQLASDCPAQPQDTAQPGSCLTSADAACGLCRGAQG